MFFRREAPPNPSVADRLAALRQSGFSVAPPSGGEVRVTRGGAGIILREADGKVVTATGAGLLMGDELAQLIDAGNQKFFRTPGGKSRPALAEQLCEIHDFEADFKEALGLESLYNESLGTVSTAYLYDRVVDRDRGVPKRAWEL